MWLTGQERRGGSDAGKGGEGAVLSTSLAGWSPVRLQRGRERQRHGCAMVYTTVLIIV